MTTKDEIEDAFQTVGIIIRAKINDLCNQRKFNEAEEIQEAYDTINKHFDNKLTCKSDYEVWEVGAKIIRDLQIENSQK